MGADPITLCRLLVGNRGVTPSALPLAAALLGSALGRAPLSLLERGYVAARSRHLPPSPPPVFILGHWRSGTTHLFNLMARDPQFAWVSPFASGMPWDFLLLGRWLRPLLARALPENRFIDNVAVNADSPQEDEIGLASMQPLSYYQAIYFPRRFEHHFRRGLFHEGVSEGELRRWRRRVTHYAHKLLVEKPGATLLVKNPVYTGQVAHLRRIWPDARFIHIHRDPYTVFQSTRKFYRRLLPKLALQPYRETMADRHILAAYPRMLERLQRDTADLPPSRFAELGFDDLESDPIASLEAVYAQLGIPDFEHARPLLERYLHSISNYRKNRHGFPPEVVEQVDRHWGEYVQRWGYRRPA